MTSLSPDQRVAFHIARTIARLRERAGLSLADLADGARIPKADLYRYETANAALRAADLPGLAEILGVTPAGLFDGLDPAGPPPAVPVPDQEGRDLVRSFLAVRDRRVRSKLVAVTRQAAGHI